VLGGGGVWGGEGVFGGGGVWGGGGVFGGEVFREEEVSAVGEGSGKVSLVLAQCIFGSRIQIR